MDKHQAIINKLKSKYEHDDSVLALLLIGSVARVDYTETSDLDLILVSKVPLEKHFEEFMDDGITVEIKKDDMERFINRMKEIPMEAYPYLEAKAVFDKDNCLPKLKAVAEEVLETYEPKDLYNLTKWLSSVKIKIISAQQVNDKLVQGYQVSNILWKIIQTLFAVNKLPTPASTSALRKVSALKNLPPNFNVLLGEILTGDLETRTQATLKFIDFCLDELDKLKRK